MALRKGHQMSMESTSNSDNDDRNTHGNSSSPLKKAVSGSQGKSDRIAFHYKLQDSGDKHNRIPRRHFRQVRPSLCGRLETHSKSFLDDHLTTSTYEESRLPVPAEIWFQILLLASSSLRGFANLSSVNRLSRTVSWNSPSCKADLIMRLHGPDKALLNIKRFGFLPDSFEILSCLLHHRRLSARPNHLHSDFGKVPPDHCSSHDALDCPVFWILFSSNSLPDSNNNVRRRGGRRCVEQSRTSQPPQLSLENRFRLASLLIVKGHLNPSHHGASLLLTAARSPNSSILRFILSLTSFPSDALGKALRHSIQFHLPEQTRILVEAGAITSVWASEAGLDCLLHSITNKDAETCTGSSHIVKNMLDAGGQPSFDVLLLFKTCKPDNVVPEWETLDRAVEMHMIEMGVMRRPRKRAIEWDAMAIAAADGCVEILKISEGVVEKAKRTGKDEMVKMLINRQWLKVVLH
ncbi:hypothetical protein BC829DRAFT_387361 [Chytridium lagenaria]|nr:hypothetical protein BC829DRAFT_387361 [Chytridium lagenaria]